MSAMLGRVRRDFAAAEARNRADAARDLARLPECQQHFVELLVELLKRAAHLIVRPEIDRKIRIPHRFEKVGQFPVDVRHVLVQQRPLYEYENRPQYVNQGLIGVPGRQPGEGDHAQDNHGDPDHDHNTEMPESDHTVSELGVEV